MDFFARLELIFSEKHEFLDNHVARFPITPNQKRTQRKREEIFSSGRAQHMDTKYWELSVSDDIDFVWETPQLDLLAAFRKGFANLFLPKMFDSLEMGGSVENPFLLVKEEDKEKSTHKTTVSERPNQPPALLRSHLFRTGIEHVPDYV